ncbi:MAG: response regulator [Sedimentitalea sp.]
MDCLIVEDDTLLCDALADCVEGMGHATDRASTIEEAMHRLKRQKYELILLDYGLPDGNGLPVSNYAALFCPGVRIILVTGNEIFPNGEHRQVAPSIDWVMRKPVCFDDLSALIDYAELDSAPHNRTHL